MKPLTYGQWFRDMVRTEAAKLSKSKYWQTMSPVCRSEWLLDRMCRRCGLSKKELTSMLKATEPSP